jgi:hypothetical protein
LTATILTFSKKHKIVTNATIELQQSVMGLEANPNAMRLATKVRNTARNITQIQPLRALIGLSREFYKSQDIWFDRSTQHRKPQHP